jgi:preprotein translocase subunit SecG
MACKLTEQVSLLIDGELPPSETRAIERHLLECAECRQVRVEFINLRSQISAYVPTPGRSLPPRLAHILSSRGKDGTQAAGNGGSLGLFGPRRWRPAFATVTVAFLIVFAISLMLHLRSQKLQKQDSNAVITSPKTVTPGKTEVRIAAAPAPSPVDGIGGLEKPRERIGRKLDQRNSNTQRRETVATAEAAGKAPRLPRDRSSRSASQPKTTRDATEYVSLNTAAGGAKGEAPIRSDDTQTLTAQHVEQSELLLRSFRNLRSGSRSTKEDLVYDRRRAQRLFYQNVLLRREADSAGDVELATLLEHLEPILLDIANLPEGAHDSEVRVIKDRLQRQNLVALLQVNSTTLTRAF